MTKNKIRAALEAEDADIKFEGDIVEENSIVPEENNFT